MLTIFTCPKAFHGHFNIIQRNAIRSWTLLQPRPEIILIGNEEGTAELSEELGLRHIPNVERNEYGTPLVSAVFRIGESEAANSLVCYINADNMLMNDFVAGVELVAARMHQEPFLLVGRRWGVELSSFWDFGHSDWEQRLRDYVMSHGQLGSVAGIDYFLFPCGVWGEIPPFALGRGRWDNWFIYQAHAKRIPVIDATPTITVVHQNHDYSHVKQGVEWLKTGPEPEANLRLRGGFLHMYTIWDADSVATPRGLKEAPSVRHLGAHFLRVQALCAYTLTITLYPYSYPLILLLRGVRWVSRAIIAALQTRKSQ